MVTSCIRLVLLMISNCGYWEYFRSRHKINIYFVPVYTIAVQFTVMLAAGILNCLKMAVFSMYGAGFLMLFQAFRKEKLKITAPYLNLGYLYYAAAVAAVGIAVFGKQVSQIDNFTHWATVVKSMLSTDRFPSFLDTAIEFSTYPLGSSAMIYYFCTMTSGAEFVMLFTQSFCVVSGLLPLFACCSRNRVPYAVLVAVMTGFFLCYNVPVTELLVDTLMPVAGMAAVLFICVHCVDREQEEARSPWYVLPLLLWALNIKHAAMIYIVFAMAVLMAAVWKRVPARKQGLLVCGSVFLARMLWSKHCEYVFGNVSLSKHSLSLRWFRMTLFDKSAETIRRTVRVTVEAMLQRPEYLWLGAWLLLVGLLAWLLLEGKRKTVCVCFAGIAVMYVAYAAGIVAMYVFSMPEYEILVSFSRYMRSMDLAVYYLVTAFSGILLSKLMTKRQILSVGLAMGILACAGWRWQTGEFGSNDFYFSATEEFRRAVEAPMERYDIETGRSYLLCLPEEFATWYDFPRYLWRYHMESGAVTQRIITEKSQLADADAFDYLIILDEDNPIVAEWVKENYPELVGETMICRYE